MIMKTLTINGQTFIVVDADAMKKIADSDLDMNGRIIRNVLNGNEDTDVATVGQLNDAVGDIENAKLDKPETAPEVGKILKVNAVNEDGTFACEWTELPSHQWRLIADVEIEEKVSEVTFSQDILGNPFSLRDAVFIVNTPACPDGANFIGYVNIFHGRETTSNSKYGGISMASKTASTFWTARASVIAGAPMYVEYSGAVEIGIAKSSGRSISFGNKLNITDAIRKMGYQMNIGIPAGTKIQIRGVDA